MFYLKVIRCFTKYNLIYLVLLPDLFNYFATCWLIGLWNIYIYILNLIHALLLCINLFIKYDEKWLSNNEALGSTSGHGQKSVLFAHFPDLLSQSQLSTRNGWCNQWHNQCLDEITIAEASFVYWLWSVLELC